jgi:hypothetical protein
MSTVFVLQHAHVLPGGEADVKLLGVYSSASSAVAAIERLRQQPGFRDAPDLVGADSDSESGFFVDEYRLDDDHWRDGFAGDGFQSEP